MDNPGYIAIIESALAEHALGQVNQPQRYIMPLPDAHNELMVMPTAMLKSKVYGAKIISLLPTNPGKGLPTVQGTISLFNNATGKIAAIIDATSITAYRTAAASAVATKWLSREESHVLSILGTGALLIPHIFAISQVRDIQRVMLWGRENNKVEEKIVKLRSLFPDITFILVGEIENAIVGVDILCTLTGAHEPIVTGKLLQPGMHINAVGAHSSEHRELDAEAIQKSRCYIDFIDLAFVEAGEYILAEKEGAINRGHVIGGIGDIIINRAEARNDKSQITLFKSLGGAVEDIALASHIYRLAEQQNIGVEIDF